MENALDAGARRVRVDVEGGGIARIEVVDDGSGMSPGDARLALERHATSKIRTFQDLTSIGTMGFRGEALPSIASVSRLVLTTSPDESGLGTEVIAERGAPPRVSPARHPKGTRVVVEDLFGNVPARRKFLKSAEAELRAVVKTVTTLALSRPDVAFTLARGKPAPPRSAAGDRDRVAVPRGPRPRGPVAPARRGLRVRRHDAHGRRHAAGRDVPVAGAPVVLRERPRHPGRDRGACRRARDARGAALGPPRGIRAVSRLRPGALRRERAPAEAGGPLPRSQRRARARPPRSRPRAHGGKGRGGGGGRGVSGSGKRKGRGRERRERFLRKGNWVAAGRRGRRGGGSLRRGPGLRALGATARAPERCSMREQPARPPLPIHRKSSLLLLLSLFFFPSRPHSPPRPVPRFVPRGRRRGGPRSHRPARRARARAVREVSREAGDRRTSLRRVS